MLFSDGRLRVHLGQCTCAGLEKGTLLLQCKGQGLPLSSPSFSKHAQIHTWRSVLLWESKNVFLNQVDHGCIWNGKLIGIIVYTQKKGWRCSFGIITAAVDVKLVCDFGVLEVLSKLLWSRALTQAKEKCFSFELLARCLASWCIVFFLGVILKF